MEPVVDELAPETMRIPPPVPEAKDVSPALTVTDPPLPLFPEPTAITIAPERPDEADPVTSDKLPLLPLEEVPVDMLMDPLTPLTPASAVFITRSPLEVELPYPVTSEILPPDD
jgi:hypothetical protein